MLTTQQKEEAETFVRAFHGDTEESFNWREFYTDKAASFTECAATWRRIARNAHLEGDTMVSATALRNALDNEELAKDALEKAKLY